MLDRFIETMRGRISRPLQYYEDICVRCGACVDACHFYAVSTDPAHIPASRMLLAKKVLQVADARDGALLNWYRDIEENDERMADRLQRAMWQCTGCRRCAVFCPLDLDTGLLVSAGRYSLLQEGLGPEMIGEIGDAELSKGEIINDIKDFYIDQMTEMETRLREEFSPDLRIPVDEKGARVLYVPLVGEEAIVPAAKIFHAAGEDWTLSLFTATNHSYFTGDMVKTKEAANWIVQEARRLGVQAIVYPECGHATRTLLYYFDSWFEEEVSNVERVSIVKLLASYLQEGRISVHPGTCEVPLTYHDPCNIGRNGGMYDEPRLLIRSVATDLRELSPSRELNWCCGGGGGLIAAMEEMDEIRLKAGRPKIEQIRETGAEWVVTACENCKTQLADLNNHYGLGIEIKGLVDLVADALLIPSSADVKEVQ
ncbi:MAG: (Fe-S)-binding protein [Anaerolineae bacterium]|jgi:Fe-S oxidoreductase